MDIVKVFGTNLKNIEQQWAYHKKLLLINAVCIAHILVQSNVTAVVFLWKIFSV